MATDGYSNIEISTELKAMIACFCKFKGLRIRNFVTDKLAQDQELAAFAQHLKRIKALKEDAYQEEAET